MAPLIPFANTSVVSTEITTKPGARTTPFPTLMRCRSRPITTFIPTPMTANKIESIGTVADMLKTTNADVGPVYPPPVSPSAFTHGWTPVRDFTFAWQERFKVPPRKSSDSTKQPDYSWKVIRHCIEYYTKTAKKIARGHLEVS